MTGGARSVRELGPRARRGREPVSPRPWPGGPETRLSPRGGRRGARGGLLPRVCHAGLTAGSRSVTPFSPGRWLRTEFRPHLRDRKSLKSEHFLRQSPLALPSPCPSPLRSPNPARCLPRTESDPGHRQAATPWEAAPRASWASPPPAQSSGVLWHRALPAAS